MSLGMIWRRSCEYALPSSQLASLCIIPEVLLFPVEILVLRDYLAAKRSDGVLADCLVVESPSSALSLTSLSFRLQ